jgi:hypothetical protein
MIPTGDTWGISGPTFLLAYLVLAVAVGVAVLRTRRALADVSAERPASRMEERPYDVAYLNGGAQLAVTAALSAMYRAGTISTAGRGVVVAGQRPESRSDELERAIHHAAGTGPVSRHALATVGGVTNARRAAPETGGRRAAGSTGGRCTVAAWGSAGGRRSPAPSPAFLDCRSVRSSRSRWGGGRAPVALPRGVAELRERGVAVVPHGVRLSLGGAEPLDPVRVTHLAACAAALDAPLVSEHVAFVRAGGREAGHLLPLPRSRAALDVLSAHVRSVQAELDVPLALEPIAALFDWPDDEYTEGEFLTALLERTGALLLLDVANVYANAVNRGTDPEALLDAIPLDRVAYVHVAGGAEHAADPGVYHDTHTDPVPPAVLALLERLRERLDVAPAVMLERDGRYPPAATLRAELDAIAAAAALPSATPAGAAPLPGAAALPGAPALPGAA